MNHINVVKDLLPVELTSKCIYRLLGCSSCGISFKLRDLTHCFLPPKWRRLSTLRYWGSADRFNLPSNPTWMSLAEGACTHFHTNLLGISTQWIKLELTAWTVLACPCLGSSESSFGRRTWGTLAGGIFVSIAACMNLEEFIKNNLIIKAICMRIH